MYYLCSENKGTDQLHSYCKADLRLGFAYADCWFSHAAAQIIVMDNHSTETYTLKLSTYLILTLNLVKKKTTDTDRRSNKDSYNCG